MAKRKVRKPVVNATDIQQVSGNATVPQITPGQLDSQLQEHIGRQLQALYNEVVEEPVPDRFLKLLEGLEGKRGEDI